MPENDLPRRFGKYVLIERIASGGMAEIYRAQVTGIASFQRIIAIKCIRPEFARDPQFSAMFIDEANLAGQLSHPNIAQIYELGRYKDLLYIAMELVEGRDVRHIVRRCASNSIEVPMAYCAYVVSKAAEALEYAYKATGLEGQALKIVHRDVSPQNILVSYDGQVKLVDFGIAKANARTSETNTGVLKGKFSYMAPEQVRGQELDNRSDIFTLGAVLYEVVTGRKLFDGDTDMEVIEKVRNATVPDLWAALPDAPPDLLRILGKALALKPEDRFQTAGEMSKAVEPLLIRERSIFGIQEAGEFMRQVFGTEADSRRAGASEAPEPEDDSGPSQVEKVIGSAFADEGPAASWRVKTSELTRPADQLKTAVANRAQLLQQAMDAEVVSGEHNLSWEGSTTEERKVPRSRIGGPELATTQPVRPWRNRRIQLIAGGAIFLLLVIILFASFGGDEVEDTPAPTETSKPEPRRPMNPPREDGSGFVTVRVTGSRLAHVFIDGQLAGKAPLIGHRVPSGSHTIRVQDVRNKKKARSQKITVEDASTRKDPLVVVIDL